MNDIQTRIEEISHKALDAAASILDQLIAPPVEKPPVDVARRALANTLGLWRFCARSRCQRAHCCHGEPSHCLRIALPLLPPEMLAALFRAPKTKRERRLGSAQRCADSVPPVSRRMISPTG